jgi:hypothetical protein
VNTPVEPKHRLLANLSLGLFSTLLTLGALECGTRVYDGQYALENFLAREQTLFSSGYPSQYDAQLGWMPREGFSGKENAWGTEVTIGEHGVRSNGPEAIALGGEARPILAVGDSFTFGDAVSDHETWPALLEQRLQQPVVNGGVFGFGVDQSYLRARRLSEIYKPRILIFSFVFDDILRCGYSERTAVGKPYFEVHDGALELRNTPVPPLSATSDLGFVRRVLGYSHATHTLMMARFKGLWLHGKNWLRETRVHRDGPNVTCEIFHELEKWAPTAGIDKVYVLVQYTSQLFPREIRLINKVLHCLEEDSLEVVDLRSVLMGLRTTDLKAFRALFRTHMTSAGNQLVADSMHVAIKAAGAAETPAEN